jgi:hypothetical protein
MAIETRCKLCRRVLGTHDGATFCSDYVACPERALERIIVRERRYIALIVLAVIAPFVLAWLRS